MTLDGILATAARQLETQRQQLCQSYPGTNHKAAVIAVSIDREHKVLLIAEAVNPEWVSILLIGWSRALGQKVNGHIVTQVRNRDAFLRAGLVEGPDLTAISSEVTEARAFRIASKLRTGEGKSWTTLQAVQSLTYGYFERLVWFQFASRIRRHQFDIVHRITPMI